MIIPPAESFKRSMSKIITHRVGSLAITFSVLSLMGAGFAESLGYTIAINAAKTIADLCYERVWVRVGWGYKLGDKENAN